MSDRFCGIIYIGGQVSSTERIYPSDPDNDTTVVDALIDVLHEEYGSREFGDTPIPCDCTVQELLEYLNDDGLLVFKNHQAVNGEFIDTEEFCRDHGIPYDRLSDHYCEYDAENVSWRPGMKQPLVQYTDSNGMEIIIGKLVREALDKLQVAIDAPAAACGLIEGIEILESLCPKIPDTLPKFEIIAKENI